ncbi:hypothetical protein VNI00_014458 [Paramarasmius palmivorus]|uniref:Uncharacterized protein n=1 Tax=Paramarasmius palmivorus TaxID=297713 RepID=A0AAW0BTM0_9AGAR
MTEATRAAKLTAIAALLECILYGILFVLFIVTIFAASRKHKITSQHVRLHSVGAIMIMLATIHVALNIHRVADAFGRGDMGAVLIPFRSASFLIKQITLTLQVIIGDAFWLYRLHVVWRGDKRATFPLGAVLLAAFAFGVHSIVLYTQSTSDASSPLSLNIRISGGVTVALGLVTNFGCTIRDVQSNPSGGGSVIMILALVVVESGALYTAFLLLWVVSLAVNSPMNSVPDQTVVQIIGIVFYMMMLPATLANHNTNNTTQSSANINSHPTNNIPLRLSQTPGYQHFGGGRDTDVLNLSPVVVHVMKWETQT